MTPTFLEQITRGYGQTERRHRNTKLRHWRGPVLLTEGQARQLFAEAYCGGQRDEEDLIAAARKGEASVFGLPVQLVDTQGESTPYLEGWI